MAPQPIQIPESLRSVVELRNRRVLLRPLEEEDAERVYDACQDQNFARWLPWAARGYTWEQAQEFIGEYSPAQWKSGNPEWGIFPLGEDGKPGELAGVIGLRQRGEGSWDIGFWMHRDQQGRGLTTSACALVVDAAFSELGATRVMHFAEVGNEASRRIARNLGFVPEGIRRVEDPLDPGRVQEQWQSALVRPDWERTVGDTGEGDYAPVPPAFVLPGARPAELVAEFHDVYKMPNAVKDGSEPSLDFGRLEMRMSLIKEEVTELVAAVYGPEAAEELASTFTELPDKRERDLVETADALADLVYVIYGMALEAGIDLDKVLAEVHSSNLSKLMPDGSVRRREDGKILKGPNFRQPDISAALDLDADADFAN